ncbi:MAG TPA: cytochrome c [Gemmatimonadaceae bacterium]|nr:cytochrome c [Gemmatimonadaceae bacterium]
MLSIVALATAGLIGCQGEAGETARATLPPPPPTPAEHADGERLFDGNCSSCHGAAARGTSVGPPLVHIFYEPNHHSDAAFHLAARNGVVAHHWNYGDMPAQPQVSAEQMTEIIGYIRWLQRTAGIQ